MGFAAHLALGSYGELSGLVTASCVALLYIAFLTRRPVAPSLDTFERQMPVLRAPVIEAALSDDQRWKAGNDGENRVTAHLSAALSDEWTLLSGYYGPGGEIDRILVGPMGVCAIEVKHLNGCVHVMADNWQMDRYDKYGNIVERARPIANKARMSPSSQVNRAVAPLERFLDRRKSVKRVRRAVVLTHDRSRVGSVQDLTVDHVSTLEALSLAKLFPAGAQFDAAEVSVAVKLIERRSRIPGAKTQQPRAQPEKIHHLGGRCNAANGSCQTSAGDTDCSERVKWSESRLRRGEWTTT